MTFHDARSVHSLRFFHYTSQFMVMFAFRTYCIYNTFRVRSTSRSLFFDTNKIDLDTPFSHPSWRNSWYGVAIVTEFTVDNTILFIQHRSRRIYCISGRCIASDQIQNIDMLRENKSISLCKNKCKSQWNQNRTSHTTTLSLYYKRRICASVIPKRKAQKDNLLSGCLQKQKASYIQFSAKKVPTK